MKLKNIIIVIMGVIICIEMVGILSLTNQRDEYKMEAELNNLKNNKNKQLYTLVEASPVTSEKNNKTKIVYTLTNKTSKNIRIEKMQVIIRNKNQKILDQMITNVKKNIPPGQNIKVNFESELDVKSINTLEYYFNGDCKTF